MTISSVRSNLVNFCPKKNLTSNNSKPIGVLTNTNLSYSVMHLPLGYLLNDFKLHRSNFLIHSLHFIHNQKEGGRHDGGYASFQINLKRLGDWFTRLIIMSKSTITKQLSLHFSLDFNNRPTI